MNPPRLPRQSTLTPLQAALCLVGALIVTGCLFLAAMQIAMLWRFIGWMFCT